MTNTESGYGVSGVIGVEGQGPIASGFGGSTSIAPSLLFVDRSLTDAATLIADWQGEIHWIDAGNGIEQITAVLADRQGLASVQILSHGSVATLQLGSTSLGLIDLDDAIATTLAQWGQAIAPEGDLLIYGCNVAVGESGAAFVQRLAQLTGADVAASDDLTGQGGDWLLEVSSGQIDLGFSLGAAVQGYGHSLASLGYSSFAGATGLALNGSASLSGGALSLTPAAGDQRGSAFATTALAITANTSFSTQFQFQLSGGQGSGGADGFVFMLQNTAAGTQAIGATGGGMGYLGTGTGSLAIKFDTYRNSLIAEPSDNFIGVLRDGSDVTPIAASAIATDLNGGQALNAWIDYDGTTNQLQVFVSQTSTKPAASLTTTLDLAAILGTQAYAGFSAGTGGLFNSQGIQSWQLTTSEAAIPNPNPNPNPDPTPSPSPSSGTWQAVSAAAINTWLQAQGITDLNAQGLINASNDFESFNASLTTALNSSGFTKVNGTSQGDYVGGGGGNDWMQGFDGGDFMRGFGGTNAVNAGLGADLVITEGGNDYLMGDAGNDNLESDGGNDLLFGGEGNDILKGQSGNDLVAGGSGDDVIEGGDDDDSLIGGSGNDRLYGGAGNDRLWGNAGLDFLWGEGGADIFNLAADEGADVILDFQDGIDKLALTGLTFAQVSIESQGANTVIRQRSNGQILATVNGVQAGQITAADFEVSQSNPTPDPIPVQRNVSLASTTYNASEVAGGSTVAVTFNRSGDLSAATTLTYALASGTAQINSDFTLPAGGNQVTFGIGAATATILIPILDDTVVEGNEVFSVSIVSATNATLLTPQTAQVTIVDNDVAPPIPGPSPSSGTWQAVSAAAINTWLQAQGITGLNAQGLINASNDFESFNAALTTALNSSGFTKVNGTAQGDYVGGGAGNDWLQGFEGGDFMRGFGGANAVNAGSGADLVITEGGNDYLMGDAGNDNLESDGGNDLLFGGADNDILKGQSGNDLVAGGSGDDVLEGGDDDDILIGGSGNDRLYGGAGNDRLWGNAGLDFLWGEGGADIFNLAADEGADVILDFQDGIDKLALTGLTFAQVSIESQGANTVIRQRSNGQILATLNGIQSSQITLADFDLSQPNPIPNPTPRYVFLGGANYSVNESPEGSVVTATLKRSGDLSVATTVLFNLESGTAQLGSDFLMPTAGNQVTFAPGSDTATIFIPILDDTLIEGPESFSIAVIEADNASLLSPRTAQVAIADNDQAPNPSPNPALIFNYGNFAGANLDLNGSANIVGGALVLTPALGDQSGSAFTTTPLSISANTSFNTQFQFQLSGGQGTNGADGFTFILQNTAGGTGALGIGGGGMGYLGSGSGSLAIKFDTYKNPTPTEPNDNFIGILRDGDDFAPLAVSAVPIDLNSGLPINAWIDYDGGTNQLRVYLSTTTTKPGTASLTTTLDLAAIVGNRAFAGFSAGTGGLFNTQAIQSWQLSTTDGVAPTPDPTPDPGQNAPLRAEKVITQLNQPTAIDFSPTGDLMFIAEKGGQIKVVKNGQTSLFLDLSDQVNSSRDRGLLSIAVDPNFYNGRPYIYALYTYDPPETANYNDGTSSPDGIGNRPSRLMRIRADVSQGYLRAVADTAADQDDRRLLLGANSIWAYTTPGNSTINTPEAQGLAPSGIVNGTTIVAPSSQVEPGTNNIRDYLATDSESHTIGTVRFGPDGALYVSNGDGTSYNVADRRSVRVQDLDNLSGKVLRISPDTGRGLADNPFFNGNADSNRSKVYQYGLRNPFRFTVNPQNNQLVIGDVGWTAWEEINSSGAGANFGWPYYEGTSTTFGYRDLPTAGGFYANSNATNPVTAFNHTSDGYNAVLLGDFNTGNRYGSSYQNALFFANTGSLNPLNGTIAAIRFNASGQTSAPVTIAEQMPYVVSMKMGPDGYLYYVQLLDQTFQGSVGRWVLA